MEKRHGGTVGTEVARSEVRLLPVHGFVLAGGKSSRMGRDKPTLNFRGRPMVEIAVEKLREFCAVVSIAGNRDDLGRYAPVVHEQRVECGPAAGIEAGLKACEQAWALFVPVDVPLVPAELLGRWATELMQRAEAGCGCSFLLVNRERQPAFCAVRRDCLATVARALDAGQRSIGGLLESVDSDDAGWLWHADAAGFSPVRDPTALQMETWFCNVNTEAELVEAEAWGEG